MRDLLWNELWKNESPGGRLSELEAKYKKMEEVRKLFEKLPGVDV